ncbi:MAG TPA: response regulator transcription factor [Pyrinomonadaceae bacterium]|jgi:DNA-binding NarL/FixJ family response regulator
MEVVGDAGDGRTAVELARQSQPDIVLMDISMPQLNGLTASAKLKRIAPDVKILTLTRHTDPAYLQELMRAGVSGYVLKQSAPAELIRAIRAVAAGDKYLDPAITGKVFEGFTGKQSKFRGGTSGERLTPREAEVPRHIALGYSNKEIADKMGVSVKTAETHKANSLRKLNMKTRRDIIGYAILQGGLQEN